MAHYRVTIRYGEPGRRYEVLDVEAASIKAALAETVQRFPEEGEAAADLVEIRRQTAPDERTYGPE